MTLDDSSGLSNRRIEKEGMYAGGVHTLLFTGVKGCPLGTCTYEDKYEGAILVLMGCKYQKHDTRTYV